MPSINCIISLRLSIEPLSWTGTIIQSPSYIGSFTISGNGLTTRLISPLFEEGSAMGIGG